MNKKVINQKFLHKNKIKKKKTANLCMYIIIFKKKIIDIICVCVRVCYRPVIKLDAEDNINTTRARNRERVREKKNNKDSKKKRVTRIFLIPRFSSGPRPPVWLAIERVVEPPSQIPPVDFSPPDPSRNFIKKK